MSIEIYIKSIYTYTKAYYCADRFYYALGFCDFNTYVGVGEGYKGYGSPDGNYYYSTRLL